MSTRTVTRRLEFDAGHRIIGHENKCKHLHGHRYSVLITVTAAGLDSVGRVIDFGVVKEIIGGWIDEHWDHNMILNSEDVLSQMYRALANEKASTLQGHPVLEIFGHKSPYIMKGNPTAENMAVELFNNIYRLLPSHITVTRVRLYETPNCYADFQP